MPEPATLARLLERWLPEYGYGADAAARQRFAHYLELVASANPRVRLVGSVEPETLVRRHLGESLYLGQVLPLARQRVVDLGAGAGFPGLALALGWPGLKTTLVEATGKKVEFLRSALTTLGLETQVEVWHDFLPPQPPSGRTPLAGANLVTVRALDKMERVPAWLGRWLDPGAQVAFWVGAEGAAAWRQQFPQWRWSQLHPLPGSRERGILLGQCST
ncbi:MAG TPA: RsmG family class I SAM-dependent methyltransferase [Terriglobales bacterium]|nr:RsmG family class I SAM-dependent methyltransferase [Terriglobales bacterium]